jgi:hypothetical protein
MMLPANGYNCISGPSKNMKNGMSRQEISVPTKLAEELIKEARGKPVQERRKFRLFRGHLLKDHFIKGGKGIRLDITRIARAAVVEGTRPDLDREQRRIDMLKNKRRFYKYHSCPHNDRSCSCWRNNRICFG